MLYLLAIDKEIRDLDNSDPQGNYISGTIFIYVHVFIRQTF